VPLLEVENLHTQFRTAQGTVRALDGVSFSLGAGETMGLVGESGCGKSMTALSLMRLVPQPAGRITDGSIVFDGHDMLRLKRSEIRRMRGKDIAMIYQDPMTSLNPIMTIRRQLSEMLVQKLHMSRKQAGQRSVELLEMVGIPCAGDRVDDYPHQFSGGMRQRVMIAMALSCGPKLVLADEPTTALDVTIQAQILDLLKSLARDSHTATVLITHDLGVVAGMTQQTHIMYGGKIVEQASTPELFANPKMPYTWGLLRSVPRLDEPRQERLAPIDGLPPDLADPPSGCRFQPRCAYRKAICAQREPELLPVPYTADNHMARCWGTQSGGWLADVDWRTDLGSREAREQIAAVAGGRAGGPEPVPDGEVDVPEPSSEEGPHLAAASTAGGGPA
jgi:oligopeptide transport system ATP-binding protein